MVKLRAEGRVCLLHLFAYLGVFLLDLRFHVLVVISCTGSVGYCWLAGSITVACIERELPT